MTVHITYLLKLLKVVQHHLAVALPVQCPLFAWWVCIQLIFKLCWQFSKCIEFVVVFLPGLINSVFEAIDVWCLDGMFRQVVPCVDCLHWEKVCMGTFSGFWLVHLFWVASGLVFGCFPEEVFEGQIFYFDFHLEHLDGVSLLTSVRQTWQLKSF